MAVDSSMSGIIWQWLQSHEQDVLDYFASIMREASDIQLVNFDEQRHMGLLATYIYQGVHRVDNVKPSTVAEGLSHLTEELIRRTEKAAAAAETNAVYAKAQGDRVDDAISGYEALYTRVYNQGNTAEQQGNNAQGIYTSVNSWFNGSSNNGFKRQAETWLADTKGDWNTWYPLTKNAWDTWYANRVSQWAQWFTDGIVPEWDTFWTGVQDDWADWTQKELQRQQNELDRIAQELARVAEENVRKAAENERIAAENTRQANEQTRQAQEASRETREGIRQETFERNEAQRQQDFEDAEDERMKAALLTRFYIDPDTMELHALQVENDDIDYHISDEGDLIASFESEE